VVKRLVIGSTDGVRSTKVAPSRTRIRCVRRWSAMKTRSVLARRSEI
jgi:hypothetical protein